MRRMKPAVYWMSLMLAYLLGQKGLPRSKDRRRSREDARRSGSWRVQ